MPDLTAEERERLYDTEIAPKLLELGKLCEANGLSLLALVEWAPGEWGRTDNVAAGASFPFRFVELAVQARGNLDSFVFALARHARKHGHNSLVLAQLDVPAVPPAPPTEG